MIFDTTFVVDLMDNDTDAIDKLNVLIKRNEPMLITTITVFELFKGIKLSTKPKKEKEKITNILNKLIIVNLDQKSAELSGLIDGALIKEGKKISVEDCMIAGIALNKKDKILTRNKKDFGKIKGLEIESY